MKRIRLLSISLAFILLFIGMLLLASCSKDEITTAIQSVEIARGGETVKLKATLDDATMSEIGDGKLYLLALELHGDELSNAEVIAQKDPKTRMSFEFPLYKDSGDSRLTCAFVLATGSEGSYTAIADERYISNPEILASSSQAPNPTSSLKGAMAEDLYNAHLLGAEHVLIDVRIDLLMLESYAEGSIGFNHEGITYFFDTEAVEVLDKQIADADRLGMRIYLKTLLGRDKENENPPYIYLDGAKNATYYLPNVSERTSVRYLNAFYAFLASRYPVCDYIIGDKVNNFSEFCNAGELSADQLTNAYLAWLRTAQLTLKSVNSSALVYLSIDDHWKNDDNSTAIGARAFLEKLNAEARRCGDFDYAVAIDIGSGEDLADLLAGKEYDYSRIGASNLSDLADLLEKESMSYGGERRRLIIDGLTLSDEIGDDNRAAYYTYAYYSAAKCKIDAFILTSDGFLSDDAGENARQAFRMCGTDNTARLSDHIELFGDINAPDPDDYKTVDLFYSESAATDIDARIMDKKNKYKISLSDFEIGGSATNLRGVLYEKANGESGRAWIIESDSAKGVGGVTLSDISAKDFIKSAYVAITAFGEGAPTLALAIYNDDRQNVDALLVGETAISENETTYYFNVTDFVKTVEDSDSLTLSLCIISEGDESVSVEITDLSLLGDSKAGSSTSTVVIIVALTVAVFVLLIVLLAVRRKKKRAPGGKKKSSDKD